MLRGVAVGLVMLRHAWPGVFGGAGIVGVTIFFTLPGFLITGIIRGDVEHRGRFSYRRFYRNRALRLLPALAALLVVFTAVAASLNPADQRGHILVTVLAATFYVADVPHLPLAVGMTHLWTLAVEEQFYLLWPTALLIAIRRRKIGALLTVAALLWLAACSVSLVAPHLSRDDVYILPTSWAITLLAGAGLQMYRNRLPRQVPGLAAAVAALVLAGLCFVPDAKAYAAMYLLGGPAIALAASVLIVRAHGGGRLPAAAAPLRALGLISYATYLWNFLIVTWFEAWFGDGVAVRLAAIAASVGLAAASWLLIEKRALGWKGRLDARRADRPNDAPLDVAAGGPAPS